MIDGFTEPQVIAALLGLIIVMLTGFFAWILHRFDQIDERIDRLDGKVDALTVAVSRLEGAVYYGLPEPRRPKEAQP